MKWVSPPEYGAQAWRWFGVATPIPRKLVAKSTISIPIVNTNELSQIRIRTTHQVGKLVSVDYNFM